MPAQSFENHSHRPVPAGIGYLFVLVAAVAFGLGGQLAFVVGLYALVGAVISLLYVSRAYITKLQDRIIKLEMRVRCASLLTPEQQRQLAALGTKQIVALRFASDVELAALVDRTVREKLAPIDVKRAIKSWTPDPDRT